MVGAFGEVQVMDWGLAKVLRPPAGEGGTPAEEGASLIATVRTLAPGDESQAGAGLGTPAYMPPEPAQGIMPAPDPPAHPFGLGAVLCEILTGRPPYVAATSMEVLLLAAAGDLADAHARLDSCRADAELVRLARACLAPQRNDRPPDASTVAAAVAAYHVGVE